MAPKRTKRTPPAPAPAVPDELAFTGRRVYRGVPARDLDRHDLERIAYRRALAETRADGIRPPTTQSSAAIAALAAELIGSGLYTPKRTEADPT